MFLSSSISSSLEFWSVNHTLIYENSELKVFKKFLFWIALIIIVNNITMLTILQLTILQWTNTTSVIFSIFSPFPFSVYYF